MEMYGLAAEKIAAGSGSSIMIFFLNSAHAVTRRARSEYVGFYVGFSIDRNIVFGIIAFNLNFCYFRIYFSELACPDILRRKTGLNIGIAPQKCEKPTQNNSPAQRQKLGIIRDLIRDFVVVSQKLPVNRQKLEIMQGLEAHFSEILPSWYLKTGVMPRGPPVGIGQISKQKNGGGQQYAESRRESKGYPVFQQEE